MSQVESAAHVGVAAHEVRGPVYRVNDPGGLLSQHAATARRHALLADELSVWELVAKPCDEQLLHLLVSLGHQVIGGALLAKIQYN